jgi:hypothetical protein
VQDEGMTLEAWTELTAVEEGRLRKAQGKLREGAALSALEQRAVDKFRAREAERGFCACFGALPQRVFRAVCGLETAREVKDVGRRIDLDVGKRTVDLGQVLPRLVAASAEVAESAGAGSDVVPEAVAVARTYRELADLLAMDAADPERTLKTYLARGMPGRPGRPGRADGWFPVSACRAWIEVHTRSNALPSGDSGDMLELRERITRLDLEIREREALEQLERLADVGEVAAFAATCVSNAKAILEALPDEVLARLPEGVDVAARRSIHDAAGRLVETALEELARLSIGDDDPTDDGDGEADDAPAGNGAAQGRGT